MNQSDEESLKRDYCAGVMTLEEIGRKYGITESGVRKKAAIGKWVRKKVRKRGAKIAKNAPQNRTKNRTKKNTGKVSNGAGSEGAEDGAKTGAKIPDFLPETKPIRGSRYDPPINAFTTHNTASLKHGAYARRLLLSDDVTIDSLNTKLSDELFLVRAANMTAVTNIGKWIARIEDATPEEQKNLLEQIAAAEKGIMRNIARIESLERSLATLDIMAVTPAKIIADTEYRVAAREKVKAETQKLTAENQGVKTPLTEAIDELQSLNKGGRL
ncbi:TPA: hypothetical protein G8O67_004745 [Salmonella enterica]|uniref:Terminase n=1 Tax=Salmonella enterica TaxID=28901 RepID=A0A756I3G1_SALER|nr:hypothetical protein [Salmonella enterica]